MASRTVDIGNALGMHARAAARFARVACGYESRITVERGGTVMDGKSIMGLLLLAAPRGSRITITATGPDEAAALDALGTLVEGGFGEGAAPRGA